MAYELAYELGMLVGHTINEYQVRITERSTSWAYQKGIPVGHTRRVYQFQGACLECFVLTFRQMEPSIHIYSIVIFHIYMSLFESTLLNLLQTPVEICPSNASPW